MKLTLKVKSLVTLETLYWTCWNVREEPLKGQISFIERRERDLVWDVN